ncbi:E3 ubiquitin-protein ligase ATL6-like [Cicer arietinum]|uniref:RING-type E3 ubiquitin transferase n=1 Tax=Cicer arietinum TaxID=3827 RepID=A0A1S2XVM7_CICAR|nr:E3 ubiquitin-protein ligase ATL6-like [Cicer arietinum]
MKNNTINNSQLFLLLILPGIILLSATKAQAQNKSNDFTDTNPNEFNPSFAIIIVILVAALFLMGFFSIYIRRCADSPTSNFVLPITDGRSRRAARGLDSSVINTFPILEYSEVKIHKIGKEILECAVCLCEFEDTETLRLIPKCDHVFHPECIDEWLSSHTTCPVCRANLVPQSGESTHGVPESNTESQLQSQNVEAQNDAVETPSEQLVNAESDPVLAVPEVIALDKTLNRNRTRGSRSNRPRRFPRSHSTGHSLVQPGENTDRFTLKLPFEVRKQIMNRQLERASSLITLPREGSSRQGYRTGGEGSSRGKTSKLLDRGFKSDRWVFNRAPSFLARALSITSTKPKVNSSDDEGTSSAAAPIMPSSAVDSARPQI